jgi:hypothetical protein
VGWAIIDAQDPSATIFIDGKEMGKGSWKGVLSPGPHVVRLLVAGARPYETTVQVVSGKEVVVRTPEKEVGPRRGLYLLGTGSILFPLVHPPTFEKPETDFGAGYGLRIGYQVNNVAAFDLSYQHSSIQTYQVGDASGEISYRLVSERVGIGLRLITPGTMWRFVATLGGGFVYDQLLRGPQAAKACSDVNDCPLSIESTKSIHGFDAFGVVELMGELDVDGVLIDLGVEAQFQATGGVALPATNITTTYNGSIYGTRPIINVGPAARVGYRFW